MRTKFNTIDEKYNHTGKVFTIFFWLKIKVNNFNYANKFRLVLGNMPTMQSFSKLRAIDRKICLTCLEKRYMGGESPRTRPKFIDFLLRIIFPSSCGHEVLPWNICTNLY